MERRITLTVPYMPVVQSLISESDLVASIRAQAARMLAAVAPLVLYEPPVTMAAWQMSMLWSRQKDSDLGLY